MMHKYNSYIQQFCKRLHDNNNVILYPSFASMIDKKLSYIYIIRGADKSCWLTDPDMKQYAETELPVVISYNGESFIIAYDDRQCLKSLLTQIKQRFKDDDNQPY